MAGAGRKGGEGGRGGQDGAWLLQLDDVVGISWKHTLSITCRMVWQDPGQAQPVLKACLGSRPGGRACAPAADTICLNVFQPRTAAPSATRAAHATASSKAVRSLFQGPGPCGVERREAAAAAGSAEQQHRRWPILALELWELGAAGKSKKLVGLATLELTLEGFPASGGEGSGAAGGCGSRLIAC